MSDPVDDKTSCITKRTLNYGNHAIFLIMGDAGVISSTVSVTKPNPLIPQARFPAGVARRFWDWSFLQLLVTQFRDNRRDPRKEPLNPNTL